MNGSATTEPMDPNWAIENPNFVIDFDAVQRKLAALSLNVVLNKEYFDTLGHHQQVSDIATTARLLGITDIDSIILLSLEDSGSIESEEELYFNRILTALAKRGVYTMDLEYLRNVREEKLQWMVIEGAKNEANAQGSAVHVESLGRECFGDEWVEGKFT